MVSATASAASAAALLALCAAAAVCSAAPPDASRHNVEWLSATPFDGQFCGGSLITANHVREISLDFAV